MGSEAHHVDRTGSGATWRPKQKPADAMPRQIPVASSDLGDGLAEVPASAQVIRNLLHLQNIVGNQAVQRILNVPSSTAAAHVQRKPTAVRHSPAKPQGGEAADAKQLESDMRDVVRDWRDASGEGVGQFVGKVLSDRIDAIESGSWANYWTSMLGNAIWAASCFMDPAFAVAVFAVNMSGVVIASLPGIPKAKKSSLPDIQKGMLDYLDLAYNHLNGQLPAASANAVSKHRAISRFEAAAHFIETNFKPEMRTEYKPYTKLPQINRIAVREQMFQKALYEFGAAETVGPAIAGITGDFSRVGRAMPGDKRPQYDSGWVIMKDDIDAVTTRYAERAALDLTYPGLSYFDREFPRLPGPGERRVDVPPTSYFYHWLSRRLLSAPKSLADNVVESLNRIPASMNWTLNSQRSKRREFVAEVSKRFDIKDPDERVLLELNGMAQRYEIGRPYHPDLYDQAVTPINGSILQQIVDLLSQARNTDKPLDERRGYIKDIVKLPQ